MTRHSSDLLPDLSVVIASVNGRPYIDACLEALHKQTGDICAEVIVADCVGLSVTELIDAHYPEVKLLTFEEKKSVSRLRSAGIMNAKGAIIAITEDHCIPSHNWYQSLIEAHQKHDGPIVGGAVDNAAIESVVDWAAFFCEYSNYISPVPGGVVHDLPGPNVSYKRAVLDGVGDILEAGYQETYLHDYLEAQGYRLWSEPSIVVKHKKYFTVGGFFSERFHYGRWYAGTRNNYIDPLRRLFFFTFSPLLPFLLTVRLSRRVFGRRRYIREFVLAYPILFIFLIAWAAGESVGYAFGPGESLYEIS